MPTRREQILAALLARLQTIPSAVKREEPLPEKVPAAGLVILRDGDPGEPEMLLSPLTYLWQHRAEIEVIVQQAPTETATAALDALLAEIGLVLSSDRTLSGLVDWIEWGAPRTRDLAIDGAAGLKAAVATVILHYASADPLA